MTLTPHVTNYELSKRLKEIGCPQKSIWKWSKKWHTCQDYEKGTKEVIPDKEFSVNRNENTISVPEVVFEWWYKDSREIEKEWYAALTASELGEIFSKNFNEWSQGWNDSGCFWHFQFGERGCGNMLEGFGIKFSALELGEDDGSEDTEANARALAVIYLKENGLIEF